MGRRGRTQARSQSSAPQRAKRTHLESCGGSRAAVPTARVPDLWHTTRNEHSYRPITGRAGSSARKRDVAAAAPAIYSGAAVALEPSMPLAGVWPAYIVSG